MWIYLQIKRPQRRNNHWKILKNSRSPSLHLNTWILLLLCVCVCRGVDMPGSGSGTTLCLVNTHMRLCLEFKDNNAAAKSVENNHTTRAAALQSHTSVTGRHTIQLQPPRSRHTCWCLSVFIQTSSHRNTSRKTSCSKRCCCLCQT